MSERQTKAKEVMPEYLKIIESDLMKATHYLKDGVKVAIVMEDKQLSEKLAEFYVEMEGVTNRFSKLIRRIVD